MLYLLTLLFGILVVFGEIIFIILWIIPRWSYRKESLSSFTPKTCIIVPCKGADKDFSQNVNALCKQQYPDYRIVFVTDSATDPAYKELKTILKTDKKTSIVLTKKSSECSGKIAALLTGIEAAGAVEVYVFADADMRPHQEWLTRLVAPLQDNTIGATTGFRWYFTNDASSQLLSTWNLASILFLFYRAFNYAWGGSTAIRKQLFEELHIAEQWKKGFSDDLIVTQAVKQSGHAIHFVPKCIVESFDEANIKRFIRWGTVQYTWVKWYYPSVWTISFIGLVGLKVLTLLGIVLLIVGYTLPGLLMVSSVIFEMCYAWIGFGTCKKTMWYPKKQLGSAVPYIFLMPIVFFLISYNMVASLFTRSITWKERVYRKAIK